MKFWIVWNEAKTEGFITNEHQLAYEIRKGSDGNCYREDGSRARTGAEFIDEFFDDNCTIQEIDL
jgi:hypothetical protein